MKTKSEIVDNWLVRYTGIELDSFGEYILLTNFDKYVEVFAEIMKCKINGADKNMPSATSNNITIINFGMGSPNAATIMDLLTACNPKGVMFLGKCGGLKQSAEIGRYILPSKIFDYLRKQKPGKNREIHITDSIRTLIKNDEKFIGHIFAGKYLDCGTFDGYVNSSIKISKLL